MLIMTITLGGLITLALIVSVVVICSKVRANSKKLAELEELIAGE